MAARSPAARSRGPLITKLIVLGSILLSVLAAGVIVASCRERALLRQAERGLETARSGGEPGPSGARVSSPSTAGTATGPSGAELEQMWQQQANAAAEAGAAPTPPSGDQTAGQQGDQVPVDESTAGESLATILQRAQAQLGQAAPATDAGAAEAGTNATPEEIANAVVNQIAAMQQQVAANQPNQEATNQPPQAAEAGAPAPESTTQPFQPTFASGAGQFTTESPIYGASSMPPPGPDDGAGRFDTERSLPPGVVYYGIPTALEAQQAAQTAAANGTGAQATSTTNLTSVPNQFPPPAPFGPPPAPAPAGTSAFPPSNATIEVPQQGLVAPGSFPPGFGGTPAASFPPVPTSFAPQPNPVPF